MKTVELPTTILIDQDISYDAKGVYCYLYSRHELHGPSFPKSINEQKKYYKCIRQLVKNKYIRIENNNVFFLK